MIELPETYVLAEQIEKTLKGNKIASAVANAHPHAFAWYTGDPGMYDGKLRGKTVTASTPGTGYTCGGNTEILCEDMLLVISTPIKYHISGSKLPAKHQLLIEFEDASRMSCTVQMWGAMFLMSVENGEVPAEYEKNKKPDPLTDGFDEGYFNSLWVTANPGLSAKAFLATEQRIPGFGNGVLHDVLWNANIHPKRKLQTMDESDRKKLFGSVKSTLYAMKTNGGRDTEKDLFGIKGGYKCVLSANTYKDSCPGCGGPIIREAYLGGNIYYCPVCQPIT